MYEEDYIMRKISNLIRFLSIVLTGKDRNSYRHSYERELGKDNDLYKNLWALLDKGRINEAEDLLFHSINPLNKNKIILAIDFYERLNKMEDEFLEENNFSRDEIEEGLRDLASMLGVDLRLYGG